MLKKLLDKTLANVNKETFCCRWRTESLYVHLLYLFKGIVRIAVSIMFCNNSTIYFLAFVLGVITKSINYLRINFTTVIIIDRLCLWHKMLRLEKILRRNLKKKKSGKPPKTNSRTAPRAQGIKVVFFVCVLRLKVYFQIF